MIEEGFINGDSIIHRLDPRVKIILASMFSIVVAISDRFMALIPAVTLAFFFVLLARLSIKKLCFRLLMVNGLILFLWLFIPFTFGGEQLFAVGPLSATKEGIIYSALITLKSNAIILALIALIASMSIFTLGHAMRSLYVPSKLIYLFLFTFRYIHVIYLEYQRLMNALKIRGFHPGTNIHT
ncbi:MAG: energy-coupling factor transporter transmembrane component T, partial [Thermodesulfobacteriota bacterium]|nr:energy-coupling factor transporter transmembrane component T [Thermodesulfobacteriota bacterium]